MAHIESYKLIYSAAVSKIGRLNFDIYYMEIFHNTLKNATSLSKVILDGETVVGFALLNENAAFRGTPSGLELTYLAVTPAEQGKGYGTMLLQHILTLQYPNVWLEVSGINAKAIGLYTKFGFRPWRHYGTKADPGIIMGYVPKLRVQPPRRCGRARPQTDGIDALLAE